MMPTDRLDAALGGWLAEDAERRVPDHLSEVLARTARTRQRRWSSPARWLPMQSLTLVRPAPVPRLAWLTALLAVAIVAGGLALSLGRPRLPAPFGVAANGLLAYQDGRSLVIGYADGRAPVRTLHDAMAGRWSPDGTRLAYVSAAGSTLTVTTVDGEPRPLLDGLVLVWNATPFAWSPDSRRLAAVTTDPEGGDRLVVLDVEGGAPVVIANEPVRHLAPAWTPDGAWVSYVASPPDEPFGELTLARPDGSERRTIPTSPLDPQAPAHRWAPDPERLRVVYLAGAYVKVYDLPAEREVPVEPGLDPVWSPDGSRVVQLAQNGAVVLEIDAIVAGRPVRRTYPLGRTTAWCAERPGEVVFCTPLAWSPDGTRIAGTDTDREWLIVAPAGETGPLVRIPIAPPEVAEAVDWQRRAPADP